MIQKIIKPITPSQRQTVLFINKFPKESIVKYLIKSKRNGKNIQIKVRVNYIKKAKGFKRANGRNNQGKITVKHRGGGHKRLYRKIEFNRTKVNKGKVCGIAYDPNRSANIAQIFDLTNYSFFYILAPEGLKEGDIVDNGSKAELKTGNALPLANLPIGSIIHNISLKPNSNGKLIRSAGTSAQLLQKTQNNYAKIRLNSGELRLILLNCYATLGIVSNINHKKIKLGKAGRNRWLNKRPHVRGVAMNPVDHPHGGGEGKTSGGRPSVSPQGKITKGKPTRSKKKKNQFILEFRKKKNVKK
jgi:large subunit ribosomal protein L2